MLRFPDLRVMAIMGPTQASPSIPMQLSYDWAIATVLNRAHAAIVQCTLDQKKTSILDLQI